MNSKYIKSTYCPISAVITRKVKQPIAKLPAFSVLAEVFGFFGLFEDVVDVLHKLSKKSRKYIKSSHRKMLEGACIGVTRTKVPVSIPKGITDLSKYKPYTCFVRGSAMNRGSVLRLEEIKITLCPVITFSSLRLKMSVNDFEVQSDLIGKRLGVEHTLKIDGGNDITRVGVKHYDGEIFGIKIERKGIAT